jgi:hypothetical protein
MQEHDFILNYAKLNPDPIGDFKNLDWDYIFRQATTHKVVPLLYTNIKNLPIPNNILKKFEQIYTYTAFHNMLYTEEMQRILHTLNNENISSVILKGPMLAQNIYGNIALRPFSDIDILIKKEHLSKAISILKSTGYVSENEKFYYKYHFHLPMVKTGRTPFNIELHWDLVDNFILHKTNINQIIDCSKNNTLADDINILYLLLHIEKHAFFNKAIYNEKDPRDWIFKNPSGNQLIWHTDIYELIKKSNLEINHLINRAKEWCIENCFYYNLYILNKLYPLRELDNLPQPKLGLVKNFIYKTAIKRENKFNIQHDMQLRPIRAIDLINYLFPPKNVLIKYYCKNHMTPVILIQIVHVFIGMKNVFEEFLGICLQKLYKTNPNNI